MAARPPPRSRRWRCIIPEPAGSGETPQSIAKPASFLSRRTVAGGDEGWPAISTPRVMNDANVDWAVFVDGSTSSVLGNVPQVSALTNVHLWDIGVVSGPFGTGFVNDVQDPSYPYRYTFIEPNYGDVYHGSYVQGSSQHPLDGVHDGELPIKTVYEAIRKSPHWDRSLLVITYDEHGGFYDHAGPPGTAKPPNDRSKLDPAINENGFIFDQYGVRVPAIVVSPLVPKGKVDHTLYDHASVPATLESLFDLKPLTDRDTHANDVQRVLSLSQPRADSDCPATLPDPASEVVGAAARPVQPLRSEVDAQPLPDRGNVHGVPGEPAKADLELRGPSGTRGDPGRFRSIETRGDARLYHEEVMTKVAAERQRHEAGRP